MEEKEHIESREYVEAVPGPAIVISRETYERIRDNNSAEENKNRLNDNKKFFKNIHVSIKPSFNKNIEEDKEEDEDSHSL